MLASPPTCGIALSLRRVRDIPCHELCVSTNLYGADSHNEVKG